MKFLGTTFMRLRVADQSINLPKLIVVTCSAIALASCGNGLGGEASAPQPGNRTFADWCRDRASLNPEAKHTVEVLLKQAGTTECDAANRKLSSLTELSLSDNKISDIKPLESLTKLTELWLFKNRINDIKPLESLTNLADLNLSYNEISDIKPLESLTNLTKLYLSDNEISDIKPLESLTNLDELWLSDNEISDIKPLESLTKLTLLNLINNRISDIKPLESLTNLTVLSLSRNPLASKTCPLKPESICKWEPLR